MKSGLLAAALVAGTLSIVSPAHASLISVIGFETGTLGPFATSVSESGYVYSSSGGLYLNDLGDPGQDMEGEDISGGGGTLDIKSATPGGDFNFVSLDYSDFFSAGAIGTQTLTVTGYLHGAKVGTDQFVLTNTGSLPYDNWTLESAIGTALDGKTIDDLQIGLYGISIGGVGVFHQSIDTVTLLSVPSVPEPASWALMLAGFAGLGGVLRARRKVATA
jgi:hypothetical protein